MVNRTAVLTVENAALANQGIYSASYMGDTPLHGAWMRLIVRGLFGADLGTEAKQTQELLSSLFQLQMSRSAPRTTALFMQMLEGF